MLQKVENICDGISEWTGQKVSWLIWIMMIMCVFEVVTRRFFNSPHKWTYDVINLFYSLHFMLLGAYTLLHKGHVSIDIFSIKLSKRTQGIIQMITYFIFCFPFFIVIFYVGLKASVSSWSFFERTSIGLPFIYPIMKTLIPVLAVLMLIQSISEFIKYLRYIIEGGTD
jgi:TRAP-type mannitol/chloroaromatic compound transport system permease small subunit